MLKDKEAKPHTESTKLSSTEVEHIASLARINITIEEREKFQKELSAILDYFKQIDPVPTDNVEPLYQTNGAKNSTRDDLPRNEFPMDESLNKKLIGQAPQKEERFVKVKSVLNK